jgi:hypothetical protein
MKRFAFMAAMAVVCAGTLKANDPPPIPKVLPRQLPTNPTLATAPKFTGVADSVYLDDELPNRSGAFGIRFEHPNAFRKLAELGNGDTDTGINSDVAALAARPSRHRRLQPAPEYSYGGWTSATAGDDTHEFSEPAITVIGQDNTTIAAYMEFPHPNPGRTSRIAVSSHAWLSAWVKQELALPASGGSAYTQSGDPVIAENPYTSGLFPGRVWVVGLSYNYLGNPFGDNQVTPWYSDDGGANWQVYGAASGHGYVHRNVLDFANGYDIDDKPTVAVSWNGNTLGYVYVAFVRSRVDSYGVDHRAIDVYALTPGSSNFEYRSTPISTTNVIHSPSLSVDAATGNIFLNWVDYTSGTINLKYSYPADQGAVFRGTLGGYTPYSFTASNLMAPGTPNLYVCENSGTSCALAASMIMTRANCIGRTVAVAYHRRKDASGAQAMFNAFDLNSFSWGTPIAVSQSTHDT